MGYDTNKDKEIQQEEFMLAMVEQRGDTPETKAGAYCVWQILNSAIGDDFDNKNTHDIGDIGAYIEYLYGSGYDSNNYYDYLLSNFTDENAPNHKYYQQVLEVYQNRAKK